MSGPERLDRRGWGAWLRVDRVLAGGPELAADGRAGRGEGATTGAAPLRLGWEQLAAGDRPRLADGERILAVLEPMPEWSLWRQRFPEGPVWILAERGTAFLSDPDAATVAALAAHLALSPAERAGDPGAATRARLAAEAEPGLASEAVEALAARPGDALPPDAIAALGRALGDASRPDALRRALLRLVAVRRVASLRGAVAPLAVPGGDLEAPALDALLSLDGGLPEDRLRPLLARDEGAVRAVALRHGAASLGRDELAAIVRDDPAPEVRAAAVAALTARPDLAALEAASAGLFDPVPEVRAEAAERLGALGATAVPMLRALAFSHGSPDAAAPLAALERAGAAGRAALAEVAETHPDERVRRLADVALGRPLGGH